jgi:hypothetical protein
MMPSAPVQVKKKGRQRSHQRSPIKAVAWADDLSVPTMPERRTHDYARNGITGLFAAFNVAGGTVTGELHRQHRAAEFKKFLVTSVRSLEKQIRDWIVDWNGNPRPFVWKKTAEEILDTLARYLRRISGAGH